MRDRFLLFPLICVVALFAFGTASRPAAAQATISIVKTDSPDPVTAGSDLTYTITATAGGLDLEDATVSDPLPAGTTFVLLSAPPGWSCSTPAVGAAGTVSCQRAPMPAGNAVFTLVVHVSPALAGGTVLTNQADFAAASGGRPFETTGSATTLVVAPTVVSGTKTVGGQTFPTGTVTYTVILTNTSAFNQGNYPGPEFTDVLPPELALVSATASTGAATANPATNTVTWDGTIPAGGSVNLTLQATVNGGTPAGTTVSNQGTVFYDADGNGTNEASAPTDDPAVGGTADPTVFTVQPLQVTAVPALDTPGLAALALLLAAAALWVFRRTSRRSIG